ncbi:MAG: ABC transporter permease subunit [Nitrososphaerales archaeon]
MNWLKIISFVSLGLLVVPIALLLYEGFGPLLSPGGYSSAVFQSIELTLLSSAIAALACAILFTPLAYYFARNKNPIGETFSDIPASIPHPIIGIALLILASPFTPFGRFLMSIGIYLFDTFLGLVVALALVSAPFYIRAIQPYFESMNVAHENFALGLGASRLRTFASVVLPNSGRGILSATLISMSRAMAEFGSIAIIAFYILQPGPFYGVSPASVFIFNAYTSTGLGVAITASALMIVLSIAVMVPIRFIRR